MRALLLETPGDLEAMAELLALIAQDKSTEVRRERAELRGGLASRCQDPRVAGLLRSESAEDRLAAGERDQGIAEYRRALALNPQDRVALDLVEEALRSSGQKTLLAEHLSFRSAFADAETRAALALQQAEIFTEEGRIDEAGAAYRLALASDPDSLLAVKGARHIAELQGDKPEMMRLLSREAALASDHGLAAGAMVEAALLATDMDSAASESAQALELRVDAAEASGRSQEAAEALQELLEIAGGDPRAESWKLRLGRLHAELGDAAAALPLLGASLHTLEGPLLLKLARGARSLPQTESVRLHRRLLEAFPAPEDPAPTQLQIAEWTEELARGHLALGQPEEAIAAHRARLEMTPPAVESVHALFGIFQAQGRADAAYCTAAALVGLDKATPEERAVVEAAAAKPLPAELPQLSDNAAVHAGGDGGAARALLEAAAVELARALPTDMSSGRGALVRGDNPVRRVVGAIARALAMPEPQLFLARNEPSVVAPVAGDAAGLLVGAEVPKRYTPRQQRFLYGRALAHVRRGTHAVAGLSPARLAAVVGELIRLTAPSGTDLSQLPPHDAALSQLLARQVSPEARERLAPFSARAAAEIPTDWEPLALGIRESAERAGLALCADPAAAIALVVAEVQGGLDRPEVAGLVRFSVSEAFLTIRPH